MKKLLFLLFLPAVLTIVSCSGKGENKKDDSMVIMQVSTDAHGLQRMQVSKSETDIKYKGKEYHSYISRTPNDSLLHVTSEMGDVYVDNQIVLRLMRGNERVFSKTFTKNSFASVVEADFLKKSVLEGVVYNKTVPEGIMFAASVCYPQTDLYMPISILITPDGKMTMRKDELLEDIYSPDSI